MPLKTCMTFIHRISQRSINKERPTLLYLQQMAALVTDYMQAYGTRFAWGCVPQRVDKLPSGALQVTWANKLTGKEEVDSFDSVLWAVGESGSGHFTTECE